MNSLVECDWLIGLYGSRLHFSKDFNEEAWEKEGVWEGSAICGSRGKWAIPGIITRMGVLRCNRCCEKIGYPPGKGSPKNDKDCETILKKRLGK